MIIIGEVNVYPSEIEEVVIPSRGDRAAASADNTV